MECENCSGHIWAWNRFKRKFGLAIIVDNEHPKYGEQVGFCSGKCYINYVSKWGRYALKSKKTKQSTEEDEGNNLQSYPKE